MGELDGRMAIVTGATRGIGRAIAVGYAREGADLAICGRTTEDLVKVKEKIKDQGRECLALAVDVGKEGDVMNFIKAVRNEVGDLDVLVNNAGISGPRAPFEDIDWDRWERVLETNVKGPVLCCRYALPMLRSSEDPSVINVSSGLGRRAIPRAGAYVVSKFGLEGLTQVLATEWKNYGIRVNSLDPGYVLTDMTRPGADRNEWEDMRRPEDVVPAAVFLASSSSRGTTGDFVSASDFL